MREQAPVLVPLRVRVLAPARRLVPARCLAEPSPPLHSWGVGECGGFAVWLVAGFTVAESENELMSGRRPEVMIGCLAAPKHAFHRIIICHRTRIRGPARLRASSGRCGRFAVQSAAPWSVGIEAISQEVALVWAQHLLASNVVRGSRMRLPVCHACLTVTYSPYRGS